MSDDIYEAKPQHLLYECGDFRLELTVNCNDVAFSSIVHGVMEPIMQPQASIRFPESLSAEWAAEFSRSRMGRRKP